MTPKKTSEEENNNENKKKNVEGGVMVRKNVSSNNITIMNNSITSSRGSLPHTRLESRKNNNSSSSTIRTIVLGAFAALALIVLIQILTTSPPSSSSSSELDSSSGILSAELDSPTSNSNNANANAASATQKLKKKKKNVPQLRMSNEEASLQATVDELDERVRQIKSELTASNGFMEQDPKGIAISKKLQAATQKLLLKRYGPTTDETPYRVKIELQFQETIPDYEENGPHGSILLEMAPISLQPYSVYMFLEIARKWKGGSFHRKAGHVLQVLVRGGIGRPLAFQEYSSQYPHTKATVGYAGRPSGPAWYISLVDNTDNHGPGSQQERNPYEADSCFGKVIQGFDDVVMKRINLMPGKGFIVDSKRHVLIKSMQIMVPKSSSSSVGEEENEEDGYVLWKPNLFYG